MEGDVENDSVVPPVEVVPVRGPVAGMDMEFDVAAEENGTNADEGRKLLAESGLKLEVANDLWEAAQKIVKLTGKAA